MDQKYNIIINHGPDRPFERETLDKKPFLKRAATLISEPKKIFIGLGDFLEVGDYNTLLDSIFFDTEGVKFESILDSSNRQIALLGDIPYSFFKLAVYFPDFLLKEVPTECVSAIGQKSRLFPGAATFIQNIKPYDPLVLTAMPREIAIEFVKRLGLGEKNLIATEYRKRIENKKEFYAGDIIRFLSGDRKSLEIEKYLNEHDMRSDEIFYIGCGEAGYKTFSAFNSIAFNPSANIIPESKITVYGSSLESLLALFNFGGRLDKYLSSYIYEEYVPSLIVYSEKRDKSRELIELELEHRTLQTNTIGQRIEHAGESYKSVEREIEIAFGGSAINVSEVKKMVTQRMEIFRKNPDELVRQIYDIARERYRQFYGD